MSNTPVLKFCTPYEADLMSWFKNEMTRLGNFEQVELTYNSSGQSSGVQVVVKESGENQSEQSQSGTGKMLTKNEINMGAWFYNQINNMQVNQGKQVDVLKLTYDIQSNQFGVYLSFTEVE